MTADRPLRIFVFSTVFAPSVGGIEQLCQNLCAEWVAMGHEVRLATLTPGAGTFSYPVLRQPSMTTFWRNLRWCNIHLQTAVSLRHLWPWLLFPGKTVFQHPVAYQSDDGSRSSADRIKAFVARHSRGIANSRYTTDRTGAPFTIFNAYDDRLFAETRPWSDRPRDLVFLGRLVSQKGCDTLLDALSHLRAEGLTPSLTIIGEGPEEAQLRIQSERLGLAPQVRFVGRLQGSALAQELGQHRVMVVPSRYLEPFGIVALEGLGCGCLPVVSQYGGLVDAVGPHGLVFPNGDAVALSGQLRRAVTEPDFAASLLAGHSDHLSRHTARSVAQAYLDVFTGTGTQHLARPRDLGTP